MPLCLALAAWGGHDDDMKLQIALMLAAAASSLGETQFEKEFTKLAQDREVALRAAAEPINRRYEASLESLQKRATQGGDLETALKVKTAIEQLGAKPQTAFAKLAGKWTVRYSNGAVREYTIRPDGTVVFDEEDGRKLSPKTTKMKIENGDTFIYWENTIERVTEVPDGFTMEHWNPKILFTQGKPGMGASASPSTKKK
jgi:hypothetical protein